MILYDFKMYMKNESRGENNFVNLYLSNRFMYVILKMDINNQVTRKIISLIVNKNTGLCNDKFGASFIDVTDKDDTISYILSNKAKPMLDKAKSIGREQEGINLCWISDRQEQKLGRFINRLFPKEFPHSEIEEFVKDYKASLAADKTLDQFKIVEGEDVRKYYKWRYYNAEFNGQLQKSCMKQDERQIFLNIYVENSNKIKMLILKDGHGKIYGRANIWYLDEPSGKIFMDRIYTTYDWQIKLFIDYAIKNNFIYKSKQIYGGNVIPVIIDGEKEKIIMTVQLKPKKYEYYPYVDTLQFYNPKTGILTSDVKKFYDKNFLSLVLANGEAYQDDGETFRIDYLGRIVHEGNLRWSEYDQVYVHINDAVLLKYRSDYVTPEHDFVKASGYICLKEDVEKDDETGEYRLKKNF
jgi:hypothetical protein